MATVRQNKNKFHRLKDDNGMWRDKDTGLENLILNYFHILCTADESISQECSHHIISSVTEEDNVMLTTPFIAMEIKDVVFSMHLDKAPGPDGMNPTFFQHYWHILGQDVCTAYLSFISNRAIPKEINAIHIVIIPKKKQIENMGDLRPISLCNVIYKIIAKAITNRHKRVLLAVISHNQSTFIPSRSTTDNLVISYEILHYLSRKSQGKQGYAVLKVDIAKAYD